MPLVALNRRNRITEILEERNWSIYRLAQAMNELRPTNTKEIHYKTVWTIANSDTIPSRTHYVNVMLIAEALNVKMDDLEQKSN